MRGGGDTTPGARDRPPRRDGLLEQLPLRRCRAQCRRPAPPGDARARLADHARGRHSTAFPPARRWRSTARRSPPKSRGRSSSHPNITVVRERIDALPDHPTIIATGPLTGSALAEAIAAETGAGRPRLLRRHRPDRPPRQHRHGRRLDGRALGQGRQGLHQLPARQGAVRGLRRGADRRREDAEFKDWEKDTPYFEGCMPIEVMAERGVETLALRPDEGGRPRQSAHRPLALCRRPAAPGQCARHACGTWSASRPS